MKKQTQLETYQRALERTEKKLEKVRGCSPLSHGWQTSQLAKASRTWDELAKHKNWLRNQINACKNDIGGDMCDHCNCWKHSRAMCS